MRPTRPSTRAVPAALLTFAALGMLAPSAHAQSIWLDRTNPKTIHLELAKPMFGGGVDEGFFTFAGFLTARLPASEGLDIVGELPMATLSSDDNGESSTMIGNPYLGIETVPAGGHGGRFEFGVRPPLASEDEFAVFAGLAADANRWEAFFPNAIYVRAAGHWRSDVRDGHPGVDLGVAPVVWIPEEDGDTELFTTYSAQVLLQAADARGGVGLSGRWFVTADDASFGEASTHQFEAAFDFLRGDVRPGFVLRVPLDEDGFFTADAVVGLTVNFVLD